MKWFCKRKNEKKLKTRILVDFLNLKFGFFQFSNIFINTFDFSGDKEDSYGIHVIMLFLELLITKKMPEKNWNNIENWQFYNFFYKILHMLKKFEHFESNSKYSLYIVCSKRKFTLMSKLGLFLMCDKNSGLWSEICDIFESYSYFSDIKPAGSEHYLIFVA